MASDKIDIVGRMGDNRETVRGRRLPVGAEVLPQGGVHFRVWARRCRQVSVIIEAEGTTGAAEQAVTLKPERDGYFSGLVTSAGAGMLYRYRLEDDANVYPDPASRF